MPNDEPKVDLVCENGHWVVAGSDPRISGSDLVSALHRCCPSWTPPGQPMGNITVKIVIP